MKDVNKVAPAALSDSVTTDPMLGFDQVVALTQQTINAQFELLFQEGVISNTLSLTQPAGGGQAVGFSGPIIAPRVNINLPDTFNPQQVEFIVPFGQGATAKFYDSVTGQPTTLQIDNWQIALTVNLQQLQIAKDFSNVAVSEKAKEAINPYINQDVYSVYGVLLNLDDVDYSTARIFKEDRTPAGTQLVAILDYLVGQLKGSKNPFLISVSPVPSGAQTGVNGFKPTSVIYNTYLYRNEQEDNDYSTYNMLVMNQGHPAPLSSATMQTFTGQPLVPQDSEAYGRMFISRDQFEHVYIEGMVLPALKTAMGTNTSFTRAASGGWSVAEGWDNGHQNDGDGPKIGSDTGVNVYGKSSTERKFFIQIDEDASTENAIVLNGHGSFKNKVDMHYYPLWIRTHYAWASREQDFTFKVTLSAGSDGKIVISQPDIVAADPKKDQWENASLKITDWLTGLLGHSFEDWVEDQNKNFKDFQDAKFTHFTTDAEGLFNNLENIVILPAASAYFFKNLTINIDGNVQLDLRSKS